jgi:hypothetical protein
MPHSRKCDFLNRVGRSPHSMEITERPPTARAPQSRTSTYFLRSTAHSSGLPSRCAPRTHALRHICRSGTTPAASRPESRTASCRTSSGAPVAIEAALPPVIIKFIQLIVAFEYSDRHADRKQFWQTLRDPGAPVDLELLSAVASSIWNTSFDTSVQDSAHRVLLVSSNAKTLIQTVMLF